MMQLMPDGTVLHIGMTGGSKITPHLHHFERARDPGKSNAPIINKAFQELVEFSQTIIIDGKAAVEAFYKLKKAFEDQPRTYKVKPRAWTPGLTAPMRRGRHK